MDNINSDDMSKVIQDALERAGEIANQRRIEQEQEFPEESLEEPDVPEELEEPGEHSLREMATLARIGKGNKTFDLQGNTIQIKTLTQEVELEILSRVNAFPQTAQSLAYNTYLAAMCLENVNGKPYFERQALGKNHDIIKYRFRKIQELHPEVISEIVNNFSILRREIREKANYAKKG